jgi:hypothetical protein
VHNEVEGAASKDKVGVAAAALVQPSEKRTDSRIGVHMSPDMLAWRDGGYRWGGGKLTSTIIGSHWRKGGEAQQCAEESKVSHMTVGS